jgi:hypothetical protein
MLLRYVSAGQRLPLLLIFLLDLLPGIDGVTLCCPATSFSPPQCCHGQSSQQGRFTTSFEENDPWGNSQGRFTSEPQSPTLGATFARVASSVMSSLKGGPIPLPTEAEIEAQAIREREASRREAERILTQEAEQRRAMEERILAMKSVSQTSLPPPQNPSAAAITPTGSPRKDKDDGIPGWWSAAKTRLTPTKELTPAQQIAQETKVKNKTEEKGHKKREKEKKRATMDPNLNLNLSLPYQPHFASKLCS